MLIAGEYDAGVMKECEVLLCWRVCGARGLERVWCWCADGCVVLEECVLLGCWMSVWCCMLVDSAAHL